MKLTKLARSPIQHVLVYGPPKVGKTELLNALVRAGFNLHYVGIEKGHAVLYKLSIEEQERVNIIDIPDTRDFPIAAETCLKIAKGDKYSICDAHGKINCPDCKLKAVKAPDEITYTEVEFNSLGPKDIVAFDSLTQLTNSIIAHITRGKPDDYKLDYDDWGNLGKLMDIFLGRIQQAKYNVICISHESEAELEDGKKKIVPVAGTRNFSRNAAKYFDHVIYAQVSNMKHTFTSMTTQTVNIVVGSRTDVDVKAGSSLVPIFTGEVTKPFEQPSIPTQSNGAKAASDLTAMLAAKQKLI